MPAFLRHRRIAAGALAILALGGTTAGCGDDPAPSGGAATEQDGKASAESVDAAFVRQMIPHHEMAIEMAQMARQKGKHEEIRTLANAIIASQGKEVAELKAAAKRLGLKLDDTAGDDGHSASMDADAATLGIAMDDMGMSMDMAKLSGAKPFDRAFIAQMTPHHEGAVAMAKAQLAKGEDDDLRALAEGIVTAQEKELAEMSTWNAAWYGDDAAGSDEASAGGSHAGH